MTQTKPWPYARVSAHRGSGTLGPENTLEGFRIGMQHGFFAMETDAMLARDNIPVLMHDEKFGRTIRDHRSVPELDAADIRTLDAGSWLAPQYCGVPPAGFEQAVRWCKANHVWLNIEIKPAMGAEVKTGTLVGELTTKLYAELIKEGGATQGGIVPEVPLFSSFKPDALRAAKMAAPNIPRGLLVDVYPDNWRKLLQELECVSFHVNHKRLTPELALEIKEMGYWLFCYTVNTPERARELFSWGVDGICTDRLDRVKFSL